MSFKSKLIYFPFVGILSVYVLGIFASFVPGWFLFFSMILTIMILLFLRKILYYSGFLIVFLLGYTQTELRKSGIENQIKTAVALNDSDIIVSGKVIEVVDREKGQRFRVNRPVLQLDTLTIKFPSILLFTETSSNISVGMDISTTGQFYAIQGPRNPGEFDFKSFYAKKGIYGRCYVDEDQWIDILNSDINLIQEIQVWVRNLFENKIGEGYGLLTALVLGDKTSVDPDIREDFTNTGVIHVLAVSGLHVGYVLMILMIIAKLFRIPWGWDRLLIIIGLCFFCFLTGGKPSVIRASLMAGIYILTPVVNRQGNLWNTIFFSAFLILLFDPLIVTDLGFIFSYTAVLSIVTFYTFIQNILPDRLKVSAIKSKPIQFLYGLFLVSLSAQIGTLPITALYFNRIPIISLVANVIIVPIIGILVAIGFCVLFFGWIPIVGDLIGQSAWFIIKFISWIADYFSQVSFAFIEIHQFSVFWMVCYFIMLSIVFMLFMPKFKKYILFPGLVILALIVWKFGMSSNYLDVIYLDVGQGDAILIQLPNRKSILIDGGQKFGNRDYGELVVKPVMNQVGIDRVNWLVMSHPHSDHIGGLISVAESFPVDTTFDTYLDYDSWVYKELKIKLKDRDTFIQHPSPGDVYQLDQNLFLEFFAPDSNFVKDNHNVNNSSIVMKLVFGTTSFLFTGDIELEGEYNLLQYKNALKSDVLKVGHHGSKTSSSELFIQMVKPDLAVVSVGYKNKFRHPSIEVIKRINQYAERIHRTDQSGALWLRSNGLEIWEVKWK